jgi:hypothetical protein
LLNTPLLPQTAALELSQISVAPKININPAPVVNDYLQKQLKLESLETTLFNSSLIAMTALNIADYLSTKKALTMPGLEEGNPMMKPFVKNPYLFAVVKGGISALSYFSMKSLYKRDKKVAWVMTTISNFLLSYVVANNMRLINRAQGR